MRESFDLTPAGATTTPFRVLVVDDDVAVRRALTRALRADGYVVTDVESAERALDVIGGRTDAFDAVVSDVIMPGMSGLALADHLQREHASLPVLLITGYPGDRLVQNAEAAARLDILQKPFSPAEFVGRVRQALDRRRGADD